MIRSVVKEGAMNSKKQARDLFFYTEAALALFALVAFLYFIGTALLIVLLQIAGWLFHAQWQPVPMGAIFLSQHGQDSMALFQDRTQPLGVVPALGNQETILSISQRFAGELVGVQKICLFILETPLWLWFAIIAIFAFGLIASAISD